MDVENCISAVVDPRDSISAISKGNEFTFFDMAAAHLLFEKAICLPG